MIYFLITIISLLIGYQIGKHDRLLPKVLNDKIKKTIDKIVLTDNSLGAITRPTQRDLDIFKNPKLAEEEKIMEETFDNLINPNGNIQS